VCTWLGLARATRESRYVDLALRLIDAVHVVLGKHRPDDARRGWLSGLGDAQARQHPTLGGLRIGKPLPEANPYDLIDTDGEMDRDGQYFHYLTKWMHALDQATRLTGDWRFNTWARELAVRAFDSFSYVQNDTGLRRLYWKMSIDLTRAAVPTPGQHDPLDGYVTYVQLRATTEFAPAEVHQPAVGGQADGLVAAIEVSHLYTADPLGLGGLLIDAARIEQLTEAGAFRNETLAAFVLAAAASGLKDYERAGGRWRPAELRLPFRELGLAVGLHGLELIAATAASPRLQALTRMLERYAPDGSRNRGFLARANQSRGCDVDRASRHQRRNARCGPCARGPDRITAAAAPAPRPTQRSEWLARVATRSSTISMRPRTPLSSGVVSSRGERIARHRGLAPAPFMTQVLHQP
jgi:hypothetical protein